MLRIKDREETIEVKKVLGIDDILALQADAKKIAISDEVLDYITKVVDASREDIHVVMGGSPRAEISFMQCAKARALIHQRNEATIDDIKFLARPVLSHRIAVRSTGGIGVNGIIDGIISLAIIFRGLSPNDLEASTKSFDLFEIVIALIERPNPAQLSIPRIKPRVSGPAFLNINAKISQRAKDGIVKSKLKIKFKA